MTLRVSLAIFQSTPPIRGATWRTAAIHKSGYFISIHAPHTGGDTSEFVQAFCKKSFQSTPPIRGATVTAPGEAELEDISIHAPHTGGDHLTFGLPKGAKDFNPRPPYGGRPSDMPKTWMEVIFQSTPPIRGATRNKPFNRCVGFISIHAPHTGGDFYINVLQHHLLHFNPRPPYGGRH